MRKLSSKALPTEVAQRVQEIKEICDQYNFWNREASPYSFRMTVRELVESNGWNNYKAYTRDSKSIIRAEINGFIEILNHWVEYQNEPDVEIHYIDGAKKGLNEVVKQSLAELFIQVKMAELV